MEDAVKPYPHITEAIRTGDVARLVELFDRFPEMTTLDVPAFGTWLHHAAAHGTPAVMRWLIGNGYQPASKRNREGTTPLVEAALQGKEENARLLLDLSVPFDTTTSNRNPLFAAISGRSLTIARMLLAAGVDTRPRYALGSSEEIVDALAFAMLRGTRDIALEIALHNENGDDQKAQQAVAGGLAVAEAITLPTAR